MHCGGSRGGCKVHATRVPPQFKSAGDTPAATAQWLGAPEAYRANQSPPLMPAQPEDAEHPARDRRWLRNDRAIYLDVIERAVETFSGLPTGELQSQHEIAHVDSRSSRDRDIYNASGDSTPQCNEAANILKCNSVIGTILKLNKRAACIGSVREADGCDVIDTLRRDQRNIHVESSHCSDEMYVRKVGIGVTSSHVQRYTRLTCDKAGRVRVPASIGENQRRRRESWRHLGHQVHGVRWRRRALEIKISDQICIRSRRKSSQQQQCAR